jgi:hypothetical protein
MDIILNKAMDFYYIYLSSSIQDLVKETSLLQCLVKNMCTCKDVIILNMPLVFYFCCIYLSSPTQDLVKVTSPLQCLVKNKSTCKEVIVPCCFSAMLTLGLSALLPWGMNALLLGGRMPGFFWEECLVAFGQMPCCPEEDFPAWLSRGLLNLAPKELFSLAP